MGNMLETCVNSEVCKAQGCKEDICQGKHIYIPSVAMDGKPCDCYKPKEKAQPAS